LKILHALLQARKTIHMQRFDFFKPLFMHALNSKTKGVSQTCMKNGKYLPTFFVVDSINPQNNRQMNITGSE
jgi:hypothetical protein